MFHLIAVRGCTVQYMGVITLEQTSFLTPDCEAKKRTRSKSRSYLFKASGGRLLALFFFKSNVKSTRWH